MERTIDLSLIIPCYNEQSYLKENLALLKQVLDASSLSYEMIIVDDSSRDRTVNIAKEFISENQGKADLALLIHGKNQGRGRTVSDGIRAARGNIAGFVDIDLSTSPWYILPLAAEIKKGADVVLGQRIYKLKLKTLHRWILSKGYKFLVRMLLGCELGDTESGCKFFKREKIIPVLFRVRDEKWFWDTEIIARAHLAGLKISQVPTVFIRESLYTSVKIMRDSWRHFINLIRFRREIRKK